MRVVLESGELEDKLIMASKAVAKKSVKPVLAGFLFEIKNGEFNLYATDMETGVRAKVNVNELEGEGRFVVDAKTILELVKIFPADVVEMFLEGDNLIITCGSSKFHLPTMDPSEFPEITPTESEAILEIDTSILDEMVDKVIFAAATDEFMRNLNGVFWELTEGFLRLVASDGFRLALAEEKIEHEITASFLLSLKSMKELANVLSNTPEPIVSIKYDGKRVSLTAGDVETIMRVVDADFPDYRRVLPPAFKTKVVVSKNELLNSLKRILVIAKKGSDAVKFDIAEGKMILSTKSPEAGEAIEEIEVQKEGEDLTIAFNPKFIVDALRKIDTEEVEMNFVDPTSPLQMNPLDVEGYIYIVMPIRLA